MNISTLIRLAAVNAVGFSASTIMPLWLGGIAGHFAQTPAFAGQAVAMQIGGAAVLNLLTPLLFRGVAPLTLARTALAVAAGAYVLAVTRSPAVFLFACLLCGSALGVVLNVTNRLMGSAEHVQKGYAIFVLIEVCFATVLFLGCAALIERWGLLSLFPAVSVAALIAIGVLMRLPITQWPQAPEGQLAIAANRSRGLLALLAFALFFIGQAALNSFMPTIGQAAGLSSAQASQIIGLGMPFGFVGAMLARVIGERIKPLVAIAVVVVVLACIAPVLTAAPVFAVFVAAAIALAISTMFCVPYFFAQLGALDRSGRYAAPGPAMMLTGVACGPAAAVMLNAKFGLPAVGQLSALLLVLGGLCFALSVKGGQRVFRSVENPR